MRIPVRLLLSGVGAFRRSRLYCYAASDEKKGLIYPVRVTLARSVMQVENKAVNIGPGMAVTVEIKTSKRRVIEYFLSPLLQYANESLRER